MFDMPFGDDLNDLPVASMQIGMNVSLVTLLRTAQQKVVTFTYNEATQHSMPRIECPAELITEEPADNSWNPFEGSRSKLSIEDLARSSMPTASQ